MKHQEYIDSMLWKRVNYDRAYWYQCIDLYKDYMDKVYWIKLGRVWNANQVWYNRYRSFDKRRKRIWGTKDLQQWDIIISTRWRYWHIAVVHSFDNRVQVLEQNGVWWWNWLRWNAIRIKDYSKHFWRGVWRFVW